MENKPEKCLSFFLKDNSCSVGRYLTAAARLKEHLNLLSLPACYIHYFISEVLLRSEIFKACLKYVIP